MSARTTITVIRKCGGQNSLSVALVAFVLIMGSPVGSFAQITCRQAIRDTDTNAQDVRKAARQLGQACQGDQQSCDAAVDTLNQALTGLDNAIANSLIPTCQPVVSVGPETPGPGELVITEINVATDDGAGHQWFEVFNPTSRELALTGIIVYWEDDYGNPVYSVISEQASIMPQSFKILALRPDLLQTDWGIQGAVQIDAQLIDDGSGVLLGGFGHRSVIELTAALGTIDTVSWFANPFSSSEQMISRQLDPDAFNSTLNDYVNVPGDSNACPTPDPLTGQCVWCSSTLTYGTNPLAYGTPAMENTECPGVQPVP